MRRGIGEQGDDAEHLDKRAGPAMGEDDRNGSGIFAALVNEMNAPGTVWKR
jgi:hypothetical protein